MGHSLEKRNELAIERKRMRQFQLICAMIEYDLSPKEMVKKLAKGDPAKAKRWKQKLWRWARDPDFARLMAEAVNGNLVMSLPQAHNALIRRASKGNVPAIKLLMESSGFYSPRSTVDHTGEIKVALEGLTRAPIVQDDAPVEIPDADVVEE